MDKLFTLLRPTSSLYLILLPYTRTNSIYSLFSNESFPSTKKHVISSVLTCYEENFPTPLFLQVLLIVSAYKKISQKSWLYSWPPILPHCLVDPHLSASSAPHPFHSTKTALTRSPLTDDLHVVEFSSQFLVFISLSLSGVFDALAHFLGILSPCPKVNLTCPKLNSWPQLLPQEMATPSCPLLGWKSLVSSLASFFFSN